MSIQSYITQIHIYYCISNNKSLISPIGHTDQDCVKHITSSGTSIYLPLCHKYYNFLILIQHFAWQMSGR